MTELLTVANLLTLLRLLLIPVFALLTVEERLAMAVVVFVTAALTDMLDGLMARRLHQSTSLGRILDPVADKVLLVTAFVILALPGHSFRPIPLWVTVMVISRDVFIVLGAAAIFLTTNFRGFRPSLPGKVSTCIQFLTVTAVLVANTGGLFLEYLSWFYILTFAATLFSGIHYIAHAARLIESARH
jgi:cardiolipin synthase